MILMYYKQRLKDINIQSWKDIKRKILRDLTAVPLLIKLEPIHLCSRLVNFSNDFCVLDLSNILKVIVIFTNV